MIAIIQMPVLGLLAEASMCHVKRHHVPTVSRSSQQFKVQDQKEVPNLKEKILEKARGVKGYAEIPAKYRQGVLIPRNKNCKHQGDYT